LQAKEVLLLLLLRGLPYPDIFFQRSQHRKSRSVVLASVLHCALSFWLLCCTAPRCLLDPDRLQRCEVLAENAAAARAADAASALLLLLSTNLDHRNNIRRPFLLSPRLLLLLVLLCPLLPPLGHFALWFGALLERAGKSALLERVKRADAAEYG
jgi:hypothetical protein